MYTLALRFADYLDRSVVIAVITMRMMQMPIHQIVDMIPVRDRLVTATRAVDMSHVVPGQGLSGSATIGIPVTYLDGMLVNVITMRVMKMPVMQIVNVVIMLDSSVAALGTVCVIVPFMNLAFSHLLPPSPRETDDIQTNTS